MTKSDISEFDTDDLIMSTTAYYLGRRTANVEDFCKRLIRSWPRLNNVVRDYIQRIVESEFARETILRRIQPDWTPFGDNCDRESWIAVRKCWLTETKGESYE